jgi:CRISPR system Cascade subunit CasE
MIHLVELGCWSTHPPEIADYGRFLDQIEVGRQYVFRLKANPVRSTKEGVAPRRRGRVVNVGSRAQQEEWLMGRAASLGFVVPEDPADLRSDAGVVLARKNLVLTGRETLRFNKLASGERLNVTLATAQFDGLLEVTDAVALRKALRQGIGRGKAYGCGLMTLAPR